MAAGLDPARFWKITPRLALAEMEAAEEGQRRVAWLGAALVRAGRLPEADEFVGAVRGGSRAARVRAWEAAMDRMDRALARNRRKGTG